jgi:hypothetical protein
MRMGAAIFVLLVLVCGIAERKSQAQSQDIDSARAKVLALENVWNRAESAGDLKALGDLFDNNLTYVEYDGTLYSKAEVLTRSKSNHLQQVITQMTKVQFFDDTAIVNGLYHARESKNGKLIFQQGRFTDTWVYKDSNWICIAAQATPIVRVSGK